MNRPLLACIAVLSYATGFISAPSGPARLDAQRGTVVAAYPSNSTHWSVETLRRAHADMVERTARSQPTSGESIVSVRTPTHNMSLLHRRHHATPVPSGQKIMSVWDDAEAHAGLSEFYVIVGGSGSIVVDGKIENVVELTDRPGEFRGQPMVGGTVYRLKEGDWLHIPPNTPHWPQPDPGGMTYLRMTINTNTTR